MSSANARVIWDANAAFNDRDLERMVALFAPDAELEDLNPAPDRPAKVRGTEELRHLFAAWFDVFAEFRADIEEMIGVGDAVVAVARYHARGSESGPPVELHAADLYEFRDGLIVRAVVGFPNAEAALAAVSRA